MKKAFFLCLTAGMVLGLTACTKDYTCTCTYKASGSSTSTTISYVYENAKKDDATATCDATETSWKLIDATASCSLD